MSAIPTLKPLGQIWTLSLFYAPCKFHFTRWVKLSTTLKCKHEVKVFLTLGLLYSSTITAQLSGPLVFRLFIILGAMYLQDQIHFWEIHPSER